MNQFDLSIIIISYNTEKITIDCLKSIIESLKNSSLKCEIIVVDNASKDNSVSSIKKLKSEIKNRNLKINLIENKENIGFGPANNQAVKLAKSDYLLFLNSDIIVLNASIEKLYNFYKQNEKLFNFLGGKLLNKDGTSQPSCGPMYTLPMIFAHLFLRGDYWGLTRYSPNKIKEADWISGACILTKKEYFEKLDGFDEKIFMYMEEIDLFYRAKKHGFKVFFYPEAQFIHLGSQSSAGRIFPILQVYQGLIYFYKKHFSQFSLFILIIMLKLKALIGFLIGKIINNQYLTQTYAKAWQISKMD
jgi:GT2 family glycosyltransferase